MPHEMREQPKLNGTQVDGFSAARYLIADGIKRDVSQFEPFASGTLNEALKKFLEPDSKISHLDSFSGWGRPIIRKDDKWKVASLDPVAQSAAPSTLAATIAVGHDDCIEARLMQEGLRGLARAADAGLAACFSKMGSNHPAMTRIVGDE
jgi:hypothetical protein